MGAQGSVLVVAVWTVGLLAGLTVSQATRVGLQTRMAGRVMEMAQASALAASGVAWATGALAGDAAREWDAANEAWAHPDQWGAGFTAEEDGWAVRDDAESPGILRVRVRDAQGTVWLNDAAPEVLARLPTLAEVTGLSGFAEAVAAAVAPGPDGEARPFVHPEELVVRAKVPPEAVEPLLAVVRVWGPKPVNLNTAPPAALTALGLDPGAAQTLCAQREARRAAGGALQDLDAVRALLREIGYDADSAPYQTMESWMTQGVADVRSSVFTVEADAVTRAHGVRRTVTAVVERTADAVRILRWQEGTTDGT